MKWRESTIVFLVHVAPVRHNIVEGELRARKGRPVKWRAAPVLLCVDVKTLVEEVNEGDGLIALG